MKHNSSNIAVFDVCGTLYRSNTTHDFVRFVFSEKSLSVRSLVYQVFNNRASPFYYFGILLYLLTKFDVHKKLNVYLLKDMSSGELSAAANLFVKKCLDKKKIAETHELIRKFQLAGMNVILCSSSIEPVVKAVAENIGVSKIVSTSLLFKQNVFTGKILEEIFDRKPKALAEILPSGNFEYAVSDNYEDLNLLRESQKPIAIVHNDKDLEFWNKQSVEIIDLRI